MSSDTLFSSRAPCSIDVTSWSRRTPGNCEQRSKHNLSHSKFVPPVACLPCLVAQMMRNSFWVEIVATPTGSSDIKTDYDLTRRQMGEKLHTNAIHESHAESADAAFSHHVHIRKWSEAVRWTEIHRCLPPFVIVIKLA